MRLLLLVVHTTLLLFVSPFSIASEDSWTEKVDLGMDFRFRQEYHDDSTKDFKRYRQRIRARLSLSGEVDENVKLYMRLTTGNSAEQKTIVSMNEDLGDGSANDPFWIDQAYVKLNFTESQWIHAGKYGIPVHRPAKSELVFDDDLSVEGISYFYDRASDGNRYFLNLSGLWLDESNSANDSSDKGIAIAQLGSKFQIGEAGLLLGVGHYSFVNLKDSDPVGGSASGNTTYDDDPTAATNNVYLYDYQLVEGIIELHHDVAGMPGMVYVHYIQNQDPDDDNIGYMAGFKIGKVKAPGDVSFHYKYRKIEKDATVGRLQDSNFADGQTDAEGSELSIKYGTFENSNIVLSYFAAKRNISTPANENDYTRVNLDFSFKF